MRFQVSGIAGEIRSAKLSLTASTNGTVDGPGRSLGERRLVRVGA